MSVCTCSVFPEYFYLWIGGAGGASSMSPRGFTSGVWYSELSKRLRAATRCYYRRRLDCLPRALAIFVLLRRQGVPARLCIGVKRYPFGAHAWVECLGDVLDDSVDDWRHEPYVPILSISEPM